MTPDDNSRLVSDILGAANAALDRGAQPFALYDVTVSAFWTDGDGGVFRKYDARVGNVIIATADTEREALAAMLRKLCER